LSALMQAVDKHATKLRAAASTLETIMRLGANEAPPAIISIFAAGSNVQEFHSIPHP